MSKEGVVNEIHKNVRKNFIRRHVIMKDIDDLWQADLVDMQSMAKDNSNYKYILVVIDTFSKYAWAYPIKLKNKINVTRAFKKLLEVGRVPKNLQTDFGAEFYNKTMKSLLDQFSINHYSTYSTKKASIIERFIRTLKGKMYKQFNLQGSYKWYRDPLEKIMNDYNLSFHRTIGLSPNEVNKNNRDIILAQYKLNYNALSTPPKSKFRVGDHVRISKYKGVFEKGYTPNWSTEIFKIIKVQNTKPFSYILEDARQRPILGAFYTEELQKTRNPEIYLIENVLKTKGNSIYVKWLGLPKEENSWIDKSNVI